MIASFTDLLPTLERRQVCLAGFDIAGGQPDFLRAILDACEEARTPALLLFWPGHSYLGFEAGADLVRSYAQTCTVPVILHLDHGPDEATVERALKAGFKSVMFDGSRFPFDENLQRTKAMAALAHAHGASIEGELGSFGSEHGTESVAGQLTDPDPAVRFVQQTGIDLFAPSVGTAHGFYRHPPKLRFDLIEAISTRAAIPLSMHGGTGIPMDDLRRATTLGVRKLNVATLLHKSYSDALVATAPTVAAKTHGWNNILAAGRAAIQKDVATYIHELNMQNLV